jgi:hypothetical protein
MKIVVAEFVNQARNKSAASADSEDQITEDYVLLTLGDWARPVATWTQLASRFGCRLWTASNSLMSSALARPPVFEMDDTLTQVAGFFRQLGQTRFGSDLDMPTTKLAMLHTVEIGGDALAYKDFDGVLAWKASAQMQEHFR